VIELYSASSREINGSDVFAPLLRHGRMLAIGVFLTVVLSRLKYKWYIPLTPLFSGLALLLGVYVLFKGEIINGARRSLTLLGIPLQPAELLKLAVVLFTALFMSRNQEKRGVKTKGVVWCAVYVLLCCGVLVTQGLTNTLLLTGISFSMMAIGGTQTRKIVAVIGVYAILGVGALAVKSHSAPQYSEAEIAHIAETGTTFDGKAATLERNKTWHERIDRWRNDTIPKYDQPITSENRQEQYSFMAQANGGVFGNLPGNGRETSRLPLAFSDYIFAIVVEDWGLVGGLVLLGLYLTLLLRAGAIAYRCKRAFPALLVMGMAVMIVLQALFHMAIVTGVFPVSGQPLPMISKGGSSIIATSIAFGIMLSVSRYAAQTDKDARAERLELPSEMAAPNPSQTR
jgi:cell division protein FtsW